ncbi:hypothetical protein WN943_026461 [Citrus x changshan-huyou]
MSILQVQLDPPKPDDDSLFPGGRILTAIDNLVIDSSETHSRVNGSTVANLYCVGCFAQIGYKFVQVEYSHDIIREGRILMDLRKLLFWNGQLIMDSMRMQPIVDAFPEQ